MIVARMEENMAAMHMVDFCFIQSLRQYPIKDTDQFLIVAISLNGVPYITARLTHVVDPEALLQSLQVVTAGKMEGVPLDRMPNLGWSHLFPAWEMNTPAEQIVQEMYNTIGKY